MSLEQRLVDLIVHATALPPDPVRDELITRIRRLKMDPDSLSIEQLRDVLTDYLQDVLSSLKASTDEASNADGNNPVSLILPFNGN